MIGVHERLRSTYGSSKNFWYVGGGEMETLAQQAML